MSKGGRPLLVAVKAARAIDGERSLGLLRIAVDSFSLRPQETTFLLSLSSNLTTQFAVFSWRAKA